MSRPESYPPGVPCFVETVAADPEPLRTFYTGVFAWEFVGSGPLPTGGEYWLARVRRTRGGRDRAPSPGPDCCAAAGLGHPRAGRFGGRREPPRGPGRRHDPA